MENDIPKTKRHKEGNETEITLVEVRPMNALFWFKYMRAILKMELADFELAGLGDTLFPDTKEMAKALKTDSTPLDEFQTELHKRNFLVKENKTKQIFFVKANSNLVKGELEWVDNFSIKIFFRPLIGN